MPDYLPPDTRKRTLTRVGGPSSRRGFLKVLGGAAAGTAALAAAGCDTGDPIDEVDVVLDFSNDFGVLNYAYALEQLEAAFYAQAAANPYAGISDVEMNYLNALKAHEGAHRDFFAAALADNAIPALEVDFSGIDFNDRTSVLSTARLLEDTGVSAYNGAGRYLQSDAYLTLAGKIVSVEARHAAAIREIFFGTETAFADLASLEDFGAVPERGLDVALPPDVVLATVASTGLVVTEIGITNL